MGCGCSEKSEEIKRYHEMIGSCDRDPNNVKEEKYSGLVEKLGDYDSSRRNY
ncbi:MAG: hypothetical protein AABW83_01110 [Nanoarchaeota archaeon]